MRILVLGSSDLFPRPDVREHDQSPELVRSRFAREEGFSLELVTKRAWPNDRLPELVGRWVAELRPDAVVLSVSDFWFNYESVPLALERRFGTVGRLVAGISLRTADSPRLAYNRFFRAVRRWWQRRVRGATYFTPHEVLGVVERSMRAVLRAEHVVLWVVGPSGDSEQYDAAHRKRRSERRALVESHLAAVCRRLHTRYISMTDQRTTPEAGFSRSGDDLHLSAEGHRQTVDHYYPMLIPELLRDIAKQGTRRSSVPDTVMEAPVDG